VKFGGHNSTKIRIIRKPSKFPSVESCEGKIRVHIVKNKQIIVQKN
jgi:hypothetical protein